MGGDDSGVAKTNLPSRILNLICDYAYCHSNRCHSNRRPLCCVFSQHLMAFLIQCVEHEIEIDECARGLASPSRLLQTQNEGGLENNWLDGSTCNRPCYRWLFFISMIYHHSRSTLGEYHLVSNIKIRGDGFTVKFSEIKEIPQDERNLSFLSL